MMSTLTPRQLREKIRNNEWTGPTSGLCPSFLQANLVILPREYADDFRRFCESNHQPCPLMEVLDAGQVSCKKLVLSGPSDVCRDLPKYRVFRRGAMVDEVPDVVNYFDDSMMSFFIGCSFSFERALMKHGIPVRNIEEGRNVSMYKTNRKCVSVGRFQDCPLVVSMRPIPEHLVPKAVQITSFFTESHGAPVHIGNPEEIGITDLSQVDFGEPVTVHEGEVPVFWACGVTAIMATVAARSEIAITHSPGHMFVTDLLEPEYKEL